MSIYLQKCRDLIIANCSISNSWFLRNLTKFVNLFAINENSKHRSSKWYRGYNPHGPYKFLKSFYSDIELPDKHKFWSNLDHISYFLYGTENIRSSRVNIERQKYFKKYFLMKNIIRLFDGGRNSINFCSKQGSVQSAISIAKKVLFRKGREGSVQFALSKFDCYIFSKLKLMYHGNF